jgi:hypothetical protein
MPREIRQIRIEGNIAYVPLTKGYEAIIDAKDALYVGAWNWHANVKENTVYARRQDYSSGSQKTVMMHAFLLRPKNGLCVDHVNGNGLDNRRENLREANAFQNAYNSKRCKVNTSMHKGVHWVATHNKWRAMIRHRTKRIFIGYFNCPGAAGIAYAAASKRLHGDFGTVRS